MSALQYVDLFGGFSLAAATHGIALSELYKNEQLPSAPEAIILTALVFISFGLVFTSIISGIGVFQGKDGDAVSKELLGQSLSYHRRLAGLLLFVTSLYAGTSLGQPKDSLFDGEWSYGEGLFLGALIYQILDSVVDAVTELFSNDDDKSKPLDGSDPRVKDKRHHDWAALATLGLSLILFLVYQAEDDVFIGYEKNATTKSWVPKFNETSLVEEDGKAHKSLIQIAMILSIIVLSAVVLALSFVQTNKILAAVGTLSSATAHTVAALLAIQVGQFLNVQVYKTEDTSYLPSNFFYFGAALLALFAAKHFDSKDRIDDDDDKSGKQKGGFTGAIALIVGVVAVFATHSLYKNVDYQGDINDSPGFEKQYKLDANGTATKEVLPAMGQVASVAREIGMYTTIIIAYIGLHGFASKLVEVGVKAVGGCVGICKDMDTDDSQLFETGRADQTIVFALSTAVLFGSRVAQGGAPALADSEQVSLWFLFIFAVAARAISFFGVILDLDMGKKGGLLWVPKTKRIFEDEGGSRKFTVKCLGGVIAIITSLIFFMVYIVNKKHFWGDAEETTTWDGVLEGLSFFLLIAHVLFTLVGIFVPPFDDGTYLHAGTIPILRFGVSSTVILTLAISVGKNILQGHTAQYSFWAFVLYVTYDVLSKGKW